MIASASQLDLEKQWRDKFPSTVSGLFAFYQCLCSIGIVGCEVGSVLIDQFNSTIYVGFWASLFLIAAWISQALAVSRCPTRRCATVTLILQCVSLISATGVISFDAYFLIRPTACFFPLSSCNSTGSKRGAFYSKANVNDIKIPIIKGQLAIAVVMLALYIGYIIMYSVTYVRVKGDKALPLKSSSKSTTSFTDGTKNSVSTKMTSASVTDSNVGEISPPSDSDADVSNKMDDAATFVFTKSTDADVLATTENAIKPSPLTTAVTEVSIENRTTKHTIITKTTHVVITNGKIVKPMSRSTTTVKGRSEKNGASTEASHILTRDPHIVTSLPLSTTDKRVPGEDPHATHVVSTEKTNLSFHGKSSATPLRSLISDMNGSTRHHISKNTVSRQMTYVSTTGENITRPSIPSVADMNNLLWTKNTENTVPTERKQLSLASGHAVRPLPSTTTYTHVATRINHANVVDSTKTTAVGHIWTTDEEVTGPLSRTNTYTNITPCIDDDDNEKLIRSKPADTDIAVANKKTTKPSSLPRADTLMFTSSDAAVQASSVEPSFQSRWSVSSND